MKEAREQDTRFVRIRSPTTESPLAQSRESNFPGPNPCSTSSAARIPWKTASSHRARPLRSVPAKWIGPSGKQFGSLLATCSGTPDKAGPRSHHGMPPFHHIQPLDERTNLRMGRLQIAEHTFRCLAPCHFEQPFAALRDAGFDRRGASYQVSNSVGSVVDSSLIDAVAVTYPSTARSCHVNSTLSQPSGKPDLRGRSPAKMQIAKPPATDCTLNSAAALRLPLGRPELGITNRERAKKLRRGKNHAAGAKSDRRFRPRVEGGDFDEVSILGRRSFRPRDFNTRRPAAHVHRRPERQGA